MEVQFYFNQSWTSGSSTHLKKFPAGVDHCLYCQGRKNDNPARSKEAETPCINAGATKTRKMGNAEKQRNATGSNENPHWLVGSSVGLKIKDPLLP
jgi:hypothetical protein